jgi:hypothetical protein
MFEEVNTKTNLPAQIDISAAPGSAYQFQFMAKGGGSANKTFMYQERRHSPFSDPLSPAPNLLPHPAHVAPPSTDTHTHTPPEL